MDQTLQRDFIERWAKYLPGAELPLAFWYADDERHAAWTRPAAGHACMIGQLALVRRGQDVAFDVDAFGCKGGARYCGYTVAPTPDFEHFLSCGIPGRLEGERYKRTPELALKYAAQTPVPRAAGRFLVFRRFDKVAAEEAPLAVVFLAPPDVLSALFTLANFGAEDLDGVVAPFCAGCGAVVAWPLAERSRRPPRAVLGLFDVSARPMVEAGHLSFAAPFELFARMAADMDESFLVTGSWERVKKRLGPGRGH